MQASELEYIENIKRSRHREYALYQIMDHFLGRKNSFKLVGKRRRKFFNQLKSEMSQGREGIVRDIDRRKDLSYDEFKNHYVKKRIPVVFEGVASEWTCCKEWSIEYFRELHGKDEIVRVNQNKMEEEYYTSTLSEVLTNILNGTDDYYRFYALLERHPEHVKDFDFNWLIKHRIFKSIFEAFQVFIGGPNSETVLHNANQSNLFTQVYGEKKWMLIPNYYTPVIDPSPINSIYRGAPYKSGDKPFDPFNPTFEPPYDLFRYVDMYTVTLKPGDVLWNPPYFWHAVKNLTPSIGVGYRWISPFYCLNTSVLYSLLDLFAVNPPIWKSYGMYKKDLNLVQLAETGRLDDYLATRNQEVVST